MRFFAFVLLAGLGFTQVAGAQPASAPFLDGAWEIIELIDNGQPVRQAVIRTELIRDSYLTIKGATINFVQPARKERRELAFVVNANAQPATLDLAGAAKFGNLGIYRLVGDTLVICLAGASDHQRPTDFTSREGSHRVLITLQKTQAQAAPVKTVVEPAAPAKNTDEQFRKLLVGTWGHQDDDMVQYLTLNSNKSFELTRTWKKGLKNVFREDVRTSGVWELTDGVIILKITASNEKNRVNQVFSYRINSLSATEVVYINQEGAYRKEWKAR